MLREHIACPKCGYDQYGLPPVRCPECGFRYDAPALRQLAHGIDWLRLAIARSLAAEATIALMLATCFIVIHRLGVTLSSLGLVLMLYAAGFVVWARLDGPFSGIAALPALVATAAGGAAILAIVACKVTILLLWGSGALLVHAWSLRLLDWPALTPVVDPDRAALRHLATRSSAIGTALLATATLVLAGVILAK